MNAQPSPLASALLHALLLTTGMAAAASNWPQFRGPQARGVDDSRPLPTAWNRTTGSNVLWQTPIAGLAHASPITWSNRIFVATATRPGKAELQVGLFGDIASAPDQEPHQWRLVVVDADSGRIVSDTLAHEGVPKVKRHTKASHCNSTPATDGRSLVALFGSEGLFCFDLDGRLRWKKDLGPMDSGFFQVPSAQWGFASSPVIHDGRAIVLCDVQTNSFVAAFDLADGRELWRTPRKDVPTWGTPAVVRTDGRTQVVVNGWHHSGGYDFRDGAELWKLTGGGDIPVPTPILASDRVILTSAHGRFRPIRAIRLDALGDITPPDPGSTNQAIAWAHPRLGNYMQTPIVVGSHLWACSDVGVVTCFDAASGEVRYSERLPGGQGYTASPVSDGRHLYFAGETGRVLVVPATPTFSITSTNTLDETCMATPAISNGSLLFRTREHLVAVGHRPAPPERRD